MAVTKIDTARCGETSGGGGKARADVMLATVAVFCRKTLGQGEQLDLVLANWERKVAELKNSNGMTPVSRWWPMTAEEPVREAGGRQNVAVIQTASQESIQQGIREQIPSVVHAGWTKEQKERAEVSVPGACLNVLHQLAPQ